MVQAKSNSLSKSCIFLRALFDFKPNSAPDEACVSIQFACAVFSRTRSNVIVTALPSTQTAISAPHLAQTVMLLVPDADLLIKCPQWQQCVISISLLFVILHHLPPKLIPKEKLNKGNYEMNHNVLVPIVEAEIDLEGLILAAKEKHEIEIMKAKHHL